MSQWLPWRLKSPLSRLFAQPFIQAHIKENIKAAHLWPCEGNLLMTSGFPSQKTSNAENVSIWWRPHDSTLCNCSTLMIDYVIYNKWQCSASPVITRFSSQQCNLFWLDLGWSGVWHCSNTGLSSSQYEQISIILGVWPFCLTPFFFRSITFWRAYGWIIFPLLKLLSFFWLTYYCSIGLCFSVRVKLSLFSFTCKLIQSLFLQWFVKLMGPSLFSFFILIGFFLG